MNSPERRETCSLWGNFHVFEIEAVHNVVRKGREEDSLLLQEQGNLQRVIFVCLRCWIKVREEHRVTPE